MNVLIACEESQRVCIEFRKKGHNAYSCDIQKCSGGHPEWHILDNVLNVLGGGRVRLQTGKWLDVDHWDMIIAHPPCTYLTVAGARWHSLKCSTENRIQGRALQTIDGIRFFMQCIQAPCDKIAVENPVGIMSTIYRKPDQIIQPYWFGDHARKKTCLWLKNLPQLQPTKMVDPGKINGDGQSHGAAADYAVDENGKILAWNDPRTAVIRSRTFPGIARAMAEQWG